MGIKIGNLNLSNILFGTRQVSKVYDGNVLKWESYNPLKLSGQWRMSEQITYDNNWGDSLSVTENINFTSNSQSFSSITILLTTTVTETEDGNVYTKTLTIKYGNTTIGQADGSMPNDYLVFNIQYTNDNYKVINFGSGKVVSQAFMDLFKIPQNEDGSLITSSMYGNSALGFALPRTHFAIDSLRFNNADSSNFLTNQFFDIVTNLYGCIVTTMYGILSFPKPDWINNSNTFSYSFYASLDNGTTRNPVAVGTKSGSIDQSKELPSISFPVTNMDDILYEEYYNSVKIYCDIVISGNTGVFYPETLHLEATLPIVTSNDIGFGVDSNNVAYVTGLNAYSFGFKQKIADTSSNYVTTSFASIENNLIDDLFPQVGTYQFYLQISGFRNTTNSVIAFSTPYVTDALTYTKTTNSRTTHIINSGTSDHLISISLKAYRRSTDYFVPEGTLSVYAILRSDGDDYSKKVLMVQKYMTDSDETISGDFGTGNDYKHIFIEFENTQHDANYVIRNIVWSASTNLGTIFLGTNCVGQDGTLTSSSPILAQKTYLTSLHTNVEYINGILSLSKGLNGTPIIYPAGKIYGELIMGIDGGAVGNAVFLHSNSLTGLIQTSSGYVLGRGANKKTRTWVVWTDNEEIKNGCTASADQYTTVTVYHLDGTPWS